MSFARHTAVGVLMLSMIKWFVAVFNCSTQTMISTLLKCWHFVWYDLICVFSEAHVTITCKKLHISGIDKHISIHHVCVSCTRRIAEIDLGFFRWFLCQNLRNSKIWRPRQDICNMTFYIQEYTGYNMYLLQIVNFQEVCPERKRLFPTMSYSSNSNVVEGVHTCSSCFPTALFTTIDAEHVLGNILIDLKLGKAKHSNIERLQHRGWSIRNNEQRSDEIGTKASPLLWNVLCKRRQWELMVDCRYMGRLQWRPQWRWSSAVSAMKSHS